MRHTTELDIENLTKASQTSTLLVVQLKDIVESEIVPLSDAAKEILKLAEDLESRLGVLWMSASALYDTVSGYSRLKSG